MRVLDGPRIVSTALAGLVLAASSLACGPKDAPDEPATTAEYLALQGFAGVDQGALTGWLRWSWLADDPVEYHDPRVVCETWDRLSGTRDQSLLAADCPGCREAYRVDGAQAQTSCQGDLALDYSPLGWVLGLAPLDPEAEALQADLAEAGFTHLGWSSWAPDGDVEGTLAAFAAFPVTWSGGEGAAPLADDGTQLHGEMELYSLYYWALGEQGPAQE